MCAAGGVPTVDHMTATRSRQDRRVPIAALGRWSKPTTERSSLEHKHSHRSLVARKVARLRFRVARPPGVTAALLVALCAFSVVSASSSAAAGRRNAPLSWAWSNEADIQHLHFRTAPINVLPGQNSVQMVTIPQNEKPKVDG